jgi:D-alanyl-lipoteichoic acid acyltransferase DltB (MBOAT superfamily)
VLWGLFKKVVIADQCAGLADPVFASFHDQSASTIAIAAFYFSLQIYCDFSGYSDIAIGLGKLLGFDLMKNFDRPYFSASMFEFWRRWHISLSTWLRDYLYIPVGGSRGTRWQTLFNLFIVFSVSGLWHGALWNYVFWGWLHFAYLLPGIFLRQQKSRSGIGSAVHAEAHFRARRWLVQALKTLSVFVLVSYAWIFFRVPGGQASIDCAQAVIDWSIFSKPDCSRIGCLWAIVLFSAEWWQGDRDHALQIGSLPVTVRWMLYAMLTVLCLGNFQENSPFIYFQF